MQIISTDNYPLNMNIFTFFLTRKLETNVPHPSDYKNISTFNFVHILIGFGTIS